jgi:hypothetical protein
MGPAADPMPLSLEQMADDLASLDFTHVQTISIPKQATWYSFKACDSQYANLVFWEIFITDLSTGKRPIFFVSGDLSNLKFFVQSLHEWDAALEALLPDFEKDTPLNEVD